MIDNLFIAIPHTESTTVEWAVSLRLLEIPCPYLISIIKGYPIHIAREELIKDAKESGASHLFFLDSDVILPKNAIQRLAEHEFPIVSALYPSKRGEWCCYRRHNGGYISVEDAERKVFEVDAVGLGACLIDMRVFDRVDPPYFGWTYTSEGGKSEDIIFCEKLRNAGFRILVNGYVVAKHVFIGNMISPKEIKTLMV
jgi:hypothetical protein